MKNFFIGIGVVLVAFVLLAFLGVINVTSWFVGRSVEVIQQQVDPAELLRKYELFKDESAQLDAKVASINREKKQIEAIQKLPNMDRTNREQLMLWQQELGGMIYSYNALAADYNSQMSKINYAFCNVGQLPRGATVPLPREYKPYMED